jgi:hypothetical protein
MIREVKTANPAKPIDGSQEPAPACRSSRRSTEPMASGVAGRAVELSPSDDLKVITADWT